MVPGPGEYRPEVSREFLDNKKNEIMPVSAVFAPETLIDRGAYAKERKSDTLSPKIAKFDPKAIYDVSGSDCTIDVKP